MSAMAAAPHAAAPATREFVVAYVALCVSVIGVGILAAISDLPTAGLVFTGLVAGIAAAGLTMIGLQARGAASLENSR